MASEKNSIPRICSCHTKSNLQLWASHCLSHRERDYTTSMLFLQNQCALDLFSANNTVKSTPENGMQDSIIVSDKPWHCTPNNSDKSLSHQSYLVTTKWNTNMSANEKNIQLYNTQMCNNVQKKSNAFINRCVNFILKDFSDQNNFHVLSKCLRNIIETNSGEFFLPMTLAFHFIDKFVKIYSVNGVSRSSEIFSKSVTLNDLSSNDIGNEGGHKFLKLSSHLLMGGNSVENSHDFSFNETLAVRGRHQSFHFGDSGLGGDLDGSSEAINCINDEKKSKGHRKNRYVDENNLSFSDYYFDDEEINLSDSCDQCVHNERTVIIPTVNFDTSDHHLVQSESLMLDWRVTSAFPLALDYSIKDFSIYEPYRKGHLNRISPRDRCVKGGEMSAGVAHRCPAVGHRTQQVRRNSGGETRTWVLLLTCSFQTSFFTLLHE